MNRDQNQSYREAGVDVEAGYRAVDLIRAHVARTTTPGVLGGLGGFGAAFELDLTGCPHPVLVSGTDGVGTKLKLAFATGRHGTIGQDCVAMCVNDIVCCGARPLFFLDYLAMGKNRPERTAEIVRGVADGCVAAGCALVGGEMAEMPGFYSEDEYDIAGFAVGLVNREDMLDPAQARAGDLLVGLPSSGLHSNGFSLVRRLVEQGGYDLTACPIGSGLSRPLGEELLEPTRIYVKPLLRLLEEKLPVSVANITGGGLYENLPRAFGEGLTAVVEAAAIPRPPIFDFLQQAGNLPPADMYGTFNMGLGMAVALRPEHVAEALALLQAEGVEAFVAGRLEAGERGVRIV
ncbi:MAG: phosphoribosylformylglycinamidine cyclo-ligase [Clostridiales bacterium]|nr:phosphoribosylformylglycinamidine cyclo-ligase [Clostridiales bacterium]